MSQVTIESLKLRIQRLEYVRDAVGQISLTEEFALEAFKMLLARLEGEQCSHVWAFSMSSVEKTCIKCGHSELVENTSVRKALRR